MSERNRLEDAGGPEGRIWGEDIPAGGIEIIPPAVDKLEVLFEDLDGLCDLLEPLHTDKDVLLVNVGRSVSRGETDLYGASSKAWLLGHRRHNVAYVCPVVKGIVLEAFKVKRWQRAHRTGGIQRYSFTGDVANDTVRFELVGKSVKHLYADGKRNPIRYINCK